MAGIQGRVRPSYRLLNQDYFFEETLIFPCSAGIGWFLVKNAGQYQSLGGLSRMVLARRCRIFGNAGYAFGHRRVIFSE